LIKRQAAGSHDRILPVCPIRQKNKIDTAIGGGPFDVDVLPDGTARYSRIRNSEDIDESGLSLPFSENSRLFASVQVAHQNCSSRSSISTEQLSDSFELAVISFRRMGGKDLDRSIWGVDGSA
jgi:hypothetical protein